jgi:hypothetical protein
MEHCEYTGGGAGHPLVVFPGWVDNDARYSPQTDIMPLKIAPVHFTDWTGRQLQLSNGWQGTNYGKRDSRDFYLNQNFSSSSGPGKPKPYAQYGNRQQPTGFSPPSQMQIQGAVFNPAAPDPNLSGGTGVLGPGVNLQNRRYYG